MFFGREVWLESVVTIFEMEISFREWDRCGWSCATGGVVLV